MSQICHNIVCGFFLLTGAFFYGVTVVYYLNRMNFVWDIVLSDLYIIVALLWTIHCKICFDACPGIESCPLGSLLQVFIMMVSNLRGVIAFRPRLIFFWNFRPDAHSVSSLCLDRLLFPIQTGRSVLLVTSPAVFAMKGLLRFHCSGFIWAQLHWFILFFICLTRGLSCFVRNLSFFPP